MPGDQRESGQRAEELLRNFQRQYLTLLAEHGVAATASPRPMRRRLPMSEQRESGHRPFWECWGDTYDVGCDDCDFEVLGLSIAERNQIVQEHRKVPTNG